MLMGHDTENKKIRVWFNQTLSSTYSIIEALKNGELGEKLEFITSSRRKEHAYLQLGDESFIEPEEAYINGEEGSKFDSYAYYALDTALKNNIDIFIPKRHLKEIAQNKEMFESCGIKVICNSYESIDITEYKSKVYEKLRGTEIEPFIPSYRLVETPEQMEEAIREYIKNGAIATIKADKDEGGDTVRFVQERVKSNFNTFEYGIPNRKISLFEATESYRHLLESVGSAGSKPFIVMPYINGKEVSIDCYIGKNMQNPIAISRVKSSRTQIVGESHRVHEPINGTETTLESLAIQIGRILDLTSGIYNVQFMWDSEHGEYRLTDVNPRTSGGMYMSILTGVNSIEYAIRDILNKNGDTIPYENNIEKIKVGKVERAVVIESKQSKSI